MPGEWWRLAIRLHVLWDARLCRVSMVFAQYSYINGVPAACREQVLRAHTFLGLNGLVNTVAPSAAFHDATRESVDNRNFIPLHNVLHICLEQCLGLWGREGGGCLVKVESLALWTAGRRKQPEYILSGDLLPLAYRQTLPKPPCLDRVHDERSPRVC